MVLEKEYVKKTFRVETDIIEKFMELKNSYGVFSDNQLFSVIINDIYELKQSKALVPFEISKGCKNSQKR